MLRVRGEDALQALCLALDVIRDILFSFREKGVRLKFVDSMEDIPLGRYFRRKDLLKKMN